jgi:hypothetical protein
VARFEGLETLILLTLGRKSIKFLQGDDITFSVRPVSISSIHWIVICDCSFCDCAGHPPSLCDCASMKEKYCKLLFHRKCRTSKFLILGYA